MIKEVCVVGRRTGTTPSSERLFAAVVPDMTVIRERRIINLRDYLRNEIDTLCAQLPPHKRVVGFDVMLQDLPRTTTRKVKRFAVQKQLDGIEQAQDGGAPRARAWSADDRAWADSPAVAGILRSSRPMRRLLPTAVHPDDSLELDLQFDSLGRIDLIVALETTLGAKLPTGKGRGVLYGSRSRRRPGAGAARAAGHAGWKAGAARAGARSSRMDSQRRSPAGRRHGGPDRFSTRRVSAPSRWCGCRPGCRHASRFVA